MDVLLLFNMTSSQMYLHHHLWTGRSRHTYRGNSAAQTVVVEWNAQTEAHPANPTLPEQWGL